VKSAAQPIVVIETLYFTFCGSRSLLFRHFYILFSSLGSPIFVCFHFIFIQQIVDSAARDKITDKKKSKQKSFSMNSKSQLRSMHTSMMCGGRKKSFRSADVVDEMQFNHRHPS
jgi:hypothetical protein